MLYSRAKSVSSSISFGSRKRGRPKRKANPMKTHLLRRYKKEERVDDLEGEEEQSIFAMSRLFISYEAIQDSKVINKEIKLLHKIFPELKEVLDFIYENKGIVYSKKLVEYIIKSSLDEVSSNIKENILKKCNEALA